MTFAGVMLIIGSILNAAYGLSAWACDSRVRSESGLKDEDVTEPEINEERITIVLRGLSG
jgi:hypothetical protein